MAQIGSYATTTSCSRSIGTFSSASCTWWRSLRSVSPRSRSSSLSPTHRIGVRRRLERLRHLQLQRAIGLAEVLPALGVAEDDAGDVDLGQHQRRDLAGERARVLLVHVLRVDLDGAPARGVDRRLEREVRRADHDVDVLDGADPRQQRADQRLSLPDRVVQLPVAGDERPSHDSAPTPGSGLPSISSSDAPPPVERCVTRSASPNCASAAAESPPPTTVVASVEATASATAFVPAAHGASSNAPIGPFQNTVPAAAISAA